MSSQDQDPDHPTDTITTFTATTTLTLPLHPSKPTYAELNPISRPTEFLGPIGTALITVLTPVTCYLLWFGCNESVGCPPPVSAWFDLGRLGLTSDSGFGEGSEGWKGLWARVFDGPAMLLYLGWYAYTVACWYFLPGDWVEGTLLRDGTRKVYKINALSTLLLTLGLTIGLLLTPSGPERFTYLYDHWLGLLTASVLMAITQAVWVYAWSFRSGELLALGGNSGVFIYDFFLGRPLNPTLPPSLVPSWLSALDIKSFNELRPGIILWLLLNISCATEQAIRNGNGLRGVEASMWLVLGGQAFYVFDALYNEAAILTTMDITTDGFGFMLSIGDLAWVPFTYTLQARFLAFHPVKLGVQGVIGVLAVFATGAYIFRISNKEKNDFRNGKNPKNLTFMDTKRGTKLLTSGWWGRSRHPNYLGDWIMAWSWCLPCGFSTPIPYFYVFYFGVLLLHRQVRDDEACHEKYGKDWEEYCKKVPWRIIPYVY